MSRAEEKDGVAYFREGDALLTLWQAAATAEPWREHARRMDLVASEHAAGLVCLTFILESSAPPDAKVRQLMQADFRRWGAKLRRFVVVPLGSPGWFSIVGAIVHGVLVVSGQAQRLRMGPTLEDALRYVREVASPDTPCDERLLLGVDALSKALGVPVQATSAS